jgi:hypothetical protein
MNVSFVILGSQTQSIPPKSEFKMTDRNRLLSSPSGSNRQTVVSDSAATQSYGTIPQEEAMDENKTTLKFIERIGFSLGHVFNDIAAGVWFSYTLLFFQGVIGLTGVQGEETMKNYQD